MVFEERVHTGGLTEISYKWDEKFELDEDRGRDIQEAYVRADERKRRERLYWVLGIIVAILIFGTLAWYLFFR